MVLKNLCKELNNKQEAEFLRRETDDYLRDGRHERIAGGIDPRAEDVISRLVAHGCRTYPGCDEIRDNAVVFSSSVGLELFLELHPLLKPTAKKYAPMLFELLSGTDTGREMLLLPVDLVEHSCQFMALADLQLLAGAYDID